MAYRHHHRHHQCCSRRGGAGKRVLYILAVGVVVAAAVSMFRGSSDRYVSPPPAPAKMSAMSASKLQGYAAERGIVGGAAAADKALAALPVHPDWNDQNRTVPVNVPAQRSPEPVAAEAGTRPVVDLSPGKPKPAIKLHRIRSDKPYPNRDMALNDALVKAGLEIRTALREMDPPVEARPGWEKIKREYLRHETISYPPVTDEVTIKQLKDHGLPTDQFWAEIDVEMTEEQVRDLRSEQRVGATGMVAAVGFVLVLALFGFLRLDAWTKGYLTGGLAVAVVAAAGAAVALLVLA